MTLDLNKPIQTRDGRKVQILATDLRGQYPIAARVELLRDCSTEKVCTYTPAGRYYGPTEDSGLDIVNVPAPAKYKLVYTDGHVSDFYSVDKASFSGYAEEGRAGWLVFQDGAAKFEAV